MIELMTANELKERMDNGEDPLDLTIDKWERVYKAVRMGETAISELRYSSDHLGADTCGLCCEADDSCANCRYFNYFKYRCTKTTNPPGHYYALFNYPDESALRKLLDALYEIKNKEGGK